MTTNKELVPLKKKVAALSELVSTLEIKTQDDLKKAVEVLSQLNQYADSVKDKKELLTKPLNLAIKNARALFSPIEELYEDSIELLREKMGNYQTEQTRIANEDKAKIAARVGEGKGKLKVETAVEKISAVITPEKEVATNSGLVQFREVKYFIIKDVSKIPYEFMVPNDKAITDAMKAGKNIEGIEYSVKQVPVNYR